MARRRYNSPINYRLREIPVKQIKAMLETLQTIKDQ